MAFTYTVNSDELHGKTRIVTGNYTNAGGSTGGDIKTGLTTVYHVNLQPKGSAILANQPVVNETLPLEKGDITIVNTANEVGTWVAVGI